MRGRGEVHGTPEDIENTSVDMVSPKLRQPPVQSLWVLSTQLRRSTYTEIFEIPGNRWSHARDPFQSFGLAAGHFVAADLAATSFQRAFQASG